MCENDMWKVFFCVKQPKNICDIAVFSVNSLAYKYQSERNIVHIKGG